MKPSEDYPRWMYHRTKEGMVVQSREEEDALGPDWARTAWPAAEESPAESVPEAAPAKRAPKKKA